MLTWTKHFLFWISDGKNKPLYLKGFFVPQPSLYCFKFYVYMSAAVHQREESCPQQGRNDVTYGSFGEVWGKSGGFSGQPQSFYITNLNNWFHSKTS